MDSQPRALGFVGQILLPQSMDSHPFHSTCGTCLRGGSLSTSSNMSKLEVSMGSCTSGRSGAGRRLFSSAFQSKVLNHLWALMSAAPPGPDPRRRSGLTCRVEGQQKRSGRGAKL